MATEAVFLIATALSNADTTVQLLPLLVTARRPRGLLTLRVTGVVGGVTIFPLFRAATTKIETCSRSGAAIPQ